MKAKLLTIVTGLMILFNPVYAQFTDSDVTLVVTGLSETYSKKFKENKSVFIEALNNSELPTEIKPLKIEVNYKNEQGFVKLTINFNVDKIYSDGSRYKSHGDQFRAFGKGISFYFQNQLMLCLSEYKFAVEREGYSVKTDLADFESVLTLKKSTGDIMNVYAYNRVGNGYGGMYPYYFYSTIDMKIAGKTYSTECGNLKTLNDMKMFFVEDLEGLDGQKTGAYYFCKFFNISVY
ncbi:hypothetical protein RDV77_02850 [Porphyromonadaceae sp. NP-X]|jgi:hypothetical protein|nr:hypothetical protein [Porphyromonadaceae sp. NP-X]